VSFEAGRQRARPASARRGARQQAPRTYTLVNWSLYRIGWLVVLVPLAIVLLAVRTPTTLPASEVPVTFDAGAARSLGIELGRVASDRTPGSDGATAAADWTANALRLAGVGVSRQRFEAPGPSGKRVPMTNVLGIARPSTGDGDGRAIVLLAPRDDVAPGPAASSAAATGTLVELARTLAGTLQNATVVLASTDGGTAGDAGARYLAAHPPPGLDIGAVVALRSIGRPGPLRLRLQGTTTRLPAAGLVRSIVLGLRANGIADVQLPPIDAQVASLLAPIGVGEQAPFVGRGMPAVTIDGTVPGLSSAGDTPDGITLARVGAIGTAVESLAQAFDNGAPPDSPARSYLISNDRVVRGWTLQLVLISLVAPPVLALFDLVARSGRRGRPLGRALRRLAERTAPAIAFAVVLRLEGVAGIVPSLGEPPWPGTGTGIGVIAVALPLIAAAATWFLLRRRRAPSTDDPAIAGIAGYAASMAWAAVATLLCGLGNPYLLILGLPALHLWLLLPSLARLGAVARLGLVALGWIGVAAVVAVLASADALHGSALPWALRLAAIGSIPLTASLGVALLAGATSQLAAIVVGRGGAPEEDHRKAHAVA
jgi:hypothetical protein